MIYLVVNNRLLRPLSFSNMELDLQKVYGVMWGIFIQKSFVQVKWQCCTHKLKCSPEPIKHAEITRGLTSERKKGMTKTPEWKVWSAIWQQYTWPHRNHFHASCSCLPLSPLSIAIPVNQTISCSVIHPAQYGQLLGFFFLRNLGMQQWKGRMQPKSSSLKKCNFFPQPIKKVHKVGAIL
jgi:hypothetical protein